MVAAVAQHGWIVDKIAGRELVLKSAWESHARKGTEALRHAWAPRCQEHAKGIIEQLAKPFALAAWFNQEWADKPRAFQQVTTKDEKEEPCRSILNYESRNMAEAPQLRKEGVENPYFLVVQLEIAGMHREIKIEEENRKGREQTVERIAPWKIKPASHNKHL